MSQHSVRYHNRVARQYDEIYDDPYWRFHDDVTWRCIKPHLPRDLAAKVADHGCGTGKWGLKLLKSGFATTFTDHAPAMLGVLREKLDAFGPKAKRAEVHEADIVDLVPVANATFALQLAMGDPLSICTDPQRAANALYRAAAPGGVVIATADAKLAATEHFAGRKNPAELIDFLQTGKTLWLTQDKREQFEMTMFTPGELCRLFTRAGFQVLEVRGKVILPVRKNPLWLEDPDDFKRLLKLELQLGDDPTTAAAASHLQVIARKPPTAG
ncbi:MAG: class I SAM-dependent methyltransferase [Phycisphaerae bacterium]